MLNVTDKSGNCACQIEFTLHTHRSISQEKLPIYLGFFDFIQNVRKRGKALLHALLQTLLSPS
jgi:hypothetical protein